MKFKNTFDKKELLEIAGLVWIFAGFMVMKVGIEAYFKLKANALFYIPIIILVFCIFYFAIFRKLVKKNFKRIADLEKERRKFLNFMDKRSYLTMAIMMSSGILIRKLLHLPDLFFFTLYTGIGAALFVAGVSEVVKTRLEI